MQHLSLRSHHRFGSCHRETIQLLKIYTLSNSDLYIWPFSPIFNPTLGYSLNYPCTCTNFYTNPSVLIKVILRKLKCWISILSNSDLDISYPCSNFHTSPSLLTQVIIRKQKHFQTFLFLVTKTLIFDSIINPTLGYPLSYVPLYQLSYKSNNRN